MKNMFYNCQSLKQINFISFKSISSYYLDLSQLFFNCEQLTQVDFGYNTFYVSNFKEMFYNCSSLLSIDIGTFRTSSFSYSYIDFSNMFYNCKNIESISIGSSTSNIDVSNMKDMLYNCTSLRQINLTGLKSSSYINMSGLFSNLINLVEVSGLSNNFNVKYAKEMFYNCFSLKSINLGFNTQSYTDISKMFYNCSN